MQRKKNVKRKQPIIQLSKKRKIKCKIKEELRDKKALNKVGGGCRFSLFFYLFMVTQLIDYHWVVCSLWFAK